MLNSNKIRLNKRRIQASNKRYLKKLFIYILVLNDDEAMVVIFDVVGIKVDVIVEVIGVLVTHES